MRTTVRANGPFDPVTTMLMLTALTVAGSELVDPDGNGLTRLLPGERGPVPVTVRMRPDGVEIEAPYASDQVECVVRDWLDLDRDLGPVDRALAADPLLAGVAGRRPGIRVVRHPDGFEATLLTLLGQQVSLAAVRTFAARLFSAYGSAGPGGLLAAPTPHRLAAADPIELQQVVGVTHSRVRTVQAAARLFEGGFSLGPSSDPSTARTVLLDLPGVGPWTVEYLAMRVLGDPDACPSSDLVLRRGLGCDAPGVALRAESWRPFRAYGVSRVWADSPAARRHVR